MGVLMMGGSVNLFDCCLFGYPGGDREMMNLKIRFVWPECLEEF